MKPTAEPDFSSKPARPASGSSSTAGFPAFSRCRLTQSFGWLAIALIGLSAGSCGKIRGWASQAQATAKNAVAKVSGSNTPAAPKPVPPDPALQALVDQTPEGAMFRMDLPFPAQVRVREERRLTFTSARALQRSAFGNQAVPLSGTLHHTTVYERAGEQIAVTLESVGFDQAGNLGPKTLSPPAGAVPPAVPKPPVGGVKPSGSQGPPPAVSVEPPGASLAGSKVTLTRRGTTWQPAHTSDFKVAGWGRELAPLMPKLGVDAGVLPRPVWFGKRRLKPGDTVPLAGPQLALLFNAQTTGEVNLRLESFEACGGHPCGVFSATGAYHEKSATADGSKFDSEVTLTAGKIWLSLVHPIVIREELDTIQTCTTDCTGMTLRIQGAVTVFITREWH
jgi:hypothetical protein